MKKKTKTITVIEITERRLEYIIFTTICKALKEFERVKGIKVDSDPNETKEEEKTSIKYSKHSTIEELGHHRLISGRLYSALRTMRYDFSDDKDTREATLYELSEIPRRVLLGKPGIGTGMINELDKILHAVGLELK